MKEQLPTDAESSSAVENSGRDDELKPDVGTSVSIQSRVARLLIKKLSEDCDKYCILTGYEDLPERFNSDIDFMVGPRDFARMPTMIDEIAAATNTRLFQAIPHEVSARAFRLAAMEGGRIEFVQPDSCSDYRHFGRLWIRADEMLASRRRHPRGFWIPGAAYECVYSLIKRVNKRDFGSAHGTRLSSLHAEEPSKCADLLRRFWSADSAKALTGMAADGNWQPLVQNLESYRSELIKHSADKFPANLPALGKRVRHTMERLLRPTGGSIAFIGPDGCGKSLVIDAIAQDFAPAFQEVVRFHLRPKSLPARVNSDVPVTDPHGQPVRGPLYSTMKMIYLFADYWLGYLIRVRPAIMRTRLVVFDRYFYDVLVDPKRVLYGGPSWLPKSLARLIPRPERVFLLDAPPEVLWSRKQEVRYEEVVRQQREYVGVASETNAVVIDAARTPSEVVREVHEAMLDYFSKRTRRELKLTGSEESSKRVE